MKLAAAAVVVVIALVLVIATSYAWFTASSAPTASGLRVNIGADNTISIAPDLTEEVQGEVVHYPGAFSKALNLLQSPSYAYLQNLLELSLVSTADGIHWYFPAYYSEDEGASATQKEFLLDDTLQYANLEQLPADGAVAGGYAMLDFWVVSPMRCSLRVSVGQGDGGSYLVELPGPIADGNGGYTLDMGNSLLSACARVGFLANTQTLTDASMQQYSRSSVYNNQYRSLRGIYQQKGQRWNYYPADFTVYEPNANLHRAEGAYVQGSDGLSYRLCANGSYVRTMPIGNVAGKAQPTDILARTVVQTASGWTPAGDNGYTIEQIFQAYLRGVSSPVLELLGNGFYKEYLGYQCGTYLQKGQFIKSSANLGRAANADTDGIVEQELFDALATAGATEDVVIVELEEDVPQRIRMFVWMEGQDVDCAGGLSAGSLLLNLELAGSSK